MDISRNQLANALRKVFGFHRLSTVQLTALAEDAQIVFFPSKKMVFIEGAKAEALYIVYQGRIEILKEKKREMHYKNLIKPFFSFGEDIFSGSQRRHSAARAETDTILIKISRGAVYELMESDAQFHRDMMRKYRTYDFLMTSDVRKIEDETLCFISQSHPIHVVLKILVYLMAVMSGGIVAIASKNGGFFAGGFFRWMLAVFAAGGLGWLAWTYLEWMNDHLFFTDKRAKSTKRTNLLFTEEQDTPLSAVESIQVRKNLLGRLFQFGELGINTYTGLTRIPNVPEAEGAQELLQFLAIRRKSESDRDALEEMRIEMKQRMHNRSDASELNDKQEGKGLDEPGMLSHQREGSEEIVLHKHFTVLAAKTFIPAFLLLSHFLFYLFVRINDLRIASSSIFNWIVLINCFILLLWVMYRYVDWHNDRFIITADTLIDIDRKPFGTEEKRTAPLERIQSVRYKKKGIFGLLFNFGTVFIRIGDEEFTFDDLHQPAEISEIIFKAKESLLDQERSTREDAERKRALDLIEAYHQMQKQENNKNNQQPISED